MAKRKADAAAEAAEAVAAAAAEAALQLASAVQSGSVGSAGVDDVPMPELGTGQQPQQPSPKRRRMTWMGTCIHYMKKLNTCSTYLGFARFVLVYVSF